MNVMWVLAWVGLPLVLLLALRWLVHRSLAPERVPNRQLPGLPGWRKLRVPTERGRLLTAWFLPQDEPSPVLVALHGWGGNADSLLPLAAPLQAAGYGVVLFDTRCHGDSDDDNFASLPRFAEDLAAVIDALKAEPSVDPARIAVFGHSVGAGAALLAAARRPDIAAVVSLAAFAHPAEMMRRWLRAKGAPWQSVEKSLLAYVQRVIGFRFDAIAPLTSMARLTCPVLLLHGANDATVPLTDAYRLQDAGGRRDVRLLVLSGSHDEFTEMEAHLGEVLAFLDSVLRRVPSSVPA